MPTLKIGKYGSGEGMWKRRTRRKESFPAFPPKIVDPPKIEHDTVCDGATLHKVVLI